MTVGQIVCSKAGSDKQTFSVVVGFADEKVKISNGKRHKLAFPKLKNPKHLSPTGEILDITSITTDKALRKALARFRSNLK